MSVETLTYWDSQYIFDTIGLGEEEQDEFLKNFEAGHPLDNKKPLEELKSAKHWRPDARYVNVSF